MKGHSLSWTNAIPAGNLSHVAAGDGHAVAVHAVFVDIDAEAGPVETFRMAFAGRDGMNRDILGEAGVGERQSPGDIGNYAGHMQRRRTGDAGFPGLA